MVMAAAWKADTRGWSRRQEQQGNLTDETTHTALIVLLLFGSRSSARPANITYLSRSAVTWKQRETRGRTRAEQYPVSGPSAVLTLFSVYPALYKP